MSRTLFLVLAATGLLFGAGVAAPAPAVGEPTTSTLATQTSIVFLGIEGDYKAVQAEELATWLQEDQKQIVFGKVLRALGDPSRRVWAIETAAPKKLLRTLKTGLKKQGFQATMLVATAVESLDKDSRNVRSACRQVERDSKVWTMWSDRKAETIWVFHESKLSAKQVEGLYRKTECAVAFAHQEIVVAPGACEDLSGMIPKLDKKLDAMRVSLREGSLVANLYLRDLDRLLVLHREGSEKIVLCPPGLREAVPADEDPASWKVTIDNDGYPFLD